jgi:hypothetical protein
MTGGRLKRVAEYIKDEEVFCFTYGDGVANVNIDDLITFHKAHGKLATVTTVQPVSRFGITMIDDQSRVTSFSEKPKVEGWVNAGFLVFDRRVFDYLKGGDNEILETEPLERLAAEGQLMAYKHDEDKVRRVSARPRRPPTVRTPSFRVRTPLARPADPPAGQPQARRRRGAAGSCPHLQPPSHPGPQQPSRRSGRGP